MQGQEKPQPTKNENVESDDAMEIIKQVQLEKMNREKETSLLKKRPATEANYKDQPFSCLEELETEVPQGNEQEVVV